MYIKLNPVTDNDFWDFSTPYQANENLINIYSELSKYYTIPTLTPLSFIGYVTSIKNAQNLINDLEGNIDKICTSIDFYFPYYESAKTWTKFPQTSGINRWILICTHLKNICDGNEGAPYPFMYDENNEIYYSNDDLVYYIKKLGV